MELAIVVAVVGILASLAVISSESFIPDMRTRSAAQEFAKNIDLMRMTAIRNNRETKLCMDTYDSAPATMSSANKGKYIMYVGNKSFNTTTWEQMPGDLYDNSSDDDQSLSTVDLSKDGKQYRKHVSIADWGSDIGGPYSGNASCIVFSTRGWLLNPPSDFNEMGFIEITFVNKVARKGGNNWDYIVMISRTGMTRLDNNKARLNDQYFSGTDLDAATAP